MRKFSLNRLRFYLIIAGGMMLFSSCTKTNVLSIDYTIQRGVYVVAYTENENVRSRMEEQLVADLLEQDIIAVKSYEDLAEIINIAPEEVVDAAMKRDMLGIIVINQVAVDGSGSVIENPRRISPVNPTLQDFYIKSRDVAGVSYEVDQEVFAEVNLFVLDEKGTTKLFWNGVTWSFHADDQNGVIRGISSLIATQLSVIRDEIR